MLGSSTIRRTFGRQLQALGKRMAGADVIKLNRRDWGGGFAPFGPYGGYGRLESAGGGPRFAGTPLVGNAAGEIGGSRQRIAARARGLVLNDAVACRIPRIWQTALVGSGYTIASQAPQSYRTAIQAEWSAFIDQADATGRLDGNALISSMLGTMVTEGEGLALFRYTADSRLQLQALPPDMLMDAYCLTGLPDSGFAANGVIFGGNGVPRAFRILNEQPENYLFLLLQGLDVPAAQVLHFFRPDSPGQSRGLSWLSPIILAISDLGIFNDALLKQQQVAALFAGFLTDTNATATGAGFSTLPQPGNPNASPVASLEPGTIQTLTPGQDVKFATPGSAQPAGSLIKNQVRTISAAVGIPYWILEDDLESVNYSSMRGSLVNFRQLVARYQAEIVESQILKPLWRRVITLGVLTGRLDLPGFDENPAPYLAATYHAPALPWVDPLKDQQATNLALASGLMSRRQAVAELGRDVEELDQEIAADNAREKSLGLAFSDATAVTDRNTDDPQD